jgi:hypothetical protein
VTDEPPIPATTRRNLVSDGGGLPLPAVVTAANVNDTLLFAALLQDMPAVRTPSGRRRSRPGKVDADKAYERLITASRPGTLQGPTTVLARASA